MKRPRIVTHFMDRGPITRSSYWIAHYEGERAAGGFGYGDTQDEAIADFIESEQERHDERLDGVCSSAGLPKIP